MTDAEFIEDIADLLASTIGTKHYPRLMRIASDMRHLPGGGAGGRIAEKSAELGRSRAEQRRLRGELRDTRIRLVAVVERIEKALAKQD